jgi:hypothetical protein
MKLDLFLVNNEIERIKILFEKNNYNNSQKRWFIEYKYNEAKAANDDLMIIVCDKLLESLEKESDS